MSNLTFVLTVDIQEVQGFYGPFSLSERVIQKIWLRCDFDQTELCLESGKSLRIIDPGRWNLLEGPDFLEARIEIDGVETFMDVEIHFNASDWNLHGHDENPNFSKVGLHVVLYPNPDGPDVVFTEKGSRPELLYLLPLLERDLEEYAIDEAILELEQIEDSEWMLQFMSEPLEHRRRILMESAQMRWLRKCEFAAKRLSGCSWSEACHQYCLEILGYSRNRAPMSQIALNHSLAEFSSGRVDLDAIFDSMRGKWKLAGLRPVNQPKNRIQQYAEICRSNPDWPQTLREVISGFESPEPADSVAAFRKSFDIGSKRKAISSVFSSNIGDKRLNTMISDGLLPLAASDKVADLDLYWLNWFAGDAPDRLHRFLKQTEVLDSRNPFSNGHLQGLLGIMISR